MIVSKEWDSLVLNKRVGELVEESSVDFTVLDGFDYVYAKVNTSDMERVHFLENLGFRTCGININYSFVLKDIFKYYTKYIRKMEKRDLDSVILIGESSFYLDRFHRDAFLTDNEADTLYAAWIKNSCVGGYADRVFVADVPNMGVVGFSTCKLSNDIGKIDLTAVTLGAAIAGYGYVGTELIKAAINYFLESKCTVVETSTQIDNTASKSALERLGFRYRGSTLVLSKG